MRSLLRIFIFHVNLLLITQLFGACFWQERESNWVCLFLGATKHLQLRVHMSVRPSLYPSVRLSITPYLSIGLPVSLSIPPSIYLLSVSPPVLLSPSLFISSSLHPSQRLKASLTEWYWRTRRPCCFLSLTRLIALSRDSRAFTTDRLTDNYTSEYGS